MLKKLVIMLGVLSLFIIIFVVHAQTISRVHHETHYIDVLKIPWGEPVDELKRSLNIYYVIPLAQADLELQCDDGSCVPFYMDGVEKNIIQTVYAFKDDKLHSISARYDAVSYTRLIERLKRDFKVGGYVSAYQYTHHIFEKNYQNSHITVEVIHRGINKPIVFSATFKIIDEEKEKKKEDNHGQVAVA